MKELEDFLDKEEREATLAAYSKGHVLSHGSESTAKEKRLQSQYDEAIGKIRMIQRIRKFINGTLVE